MADLPPAVRARRAVEDRAIALGRERAGLNKREGEIIEEAVELMEQATAVGVSNDQLAELLQISHPTLYRWRGALERLRAAQED
ncbi:MAG: hypothetical protein ACYDHT_06645 [Solirubrobacteraceae bacterium]